MKRLLFCITILALALGLAGCSGQPALTPSSLSGAPEETGGEETGGIEWEIAQPTPAALPAIDPALLTRPHEEGYAEIDIDKADQYRDFVLEERITDQYGSSTFFRLVDGKYVQLGSLDGYVTEMLGKPGILLDGLGYLYEDAHSVHLGWARIGRIYEVRDMRLVELPPISHVYYPVEEHEFEVLQSISIYWTGRTTQELKAMSPEDYTPFDWPVIGGDRYHKHMPIGKGDTVAVFGTDERGNVLLDYKGKGYLLPMATSAQTDTWGDLLENLRFFNEYFYNEQVDGYYYAG